MKEQILAALDDHATGLAEMQAHVNQLDADDMAASDQGHVKAIKEALPEALASIAELRMALSAVLE